MEPKRERDSRPAPDLTDAQVGRLLRLYTEEGRAEAQMSFLNPDTTALLKTAEERGILEAGYISVANDHVLIAQALATLVERKLRVQDVTLIPHEAITQAVIEEILGYSHRNEEEKAQIQILHPEIDVDLLADLLQRRLCTQEEAFLVLTDAGSFRKLAARNEKL